jgi:hypothetical protein
MSMERPYVSCVIKLKNSNDHLNMDIDAFEMTTVQTFCVKSCL